MKILILCGGKGLRLRPITENIPKPMVPIRGTPIVEHIIEYFSARGFREFVLAIGYKGDIIKSHFKGKQYRIEYVDSGDSDILRRIKDALPYLTERFIVVYGDTIADVDLKSLLSFHTSKSSNLTLTTYQMQSPFGLVFSDNGVITNFSEKPMLDYWMNIGFMVFEKSCLEMASGDDDLVSFFGKILKHGRMFEYRHIGKHITVNGEKEKEIAEKEIMHFYTVGGGF